MRVIVLRHFVAFVACLAPAFAWAETRLMMAEETGCIWCEQWNVEIGPIYPKTAEGRAAPLERFDIDSPPDDIQFSRPINFTPTFILVRDGVEVGRIDGYPGEDFFWGLLGTLLKSADIPIAPAG